MFLSSPDNLEPASAIRRTLGWFGNAYKRLSLSMLLSLLFHISLIALVVLLILYVNLDRPRSLQKEISVTLTSAEELDETSSIQENNYGQTSEESPKDSEPTVAETMEQQLRKEYDRELEPLVGNIEQAATVEARKEAEKKIQQLETEYTHQMDKRVETIARQLAESSEQQNKLREKAAAVIQDIAKSQKRKERWARWTILHSEYQGIDRVGGRLVVVDYPQPGRYTYVVNLNGAPRLETGSKPDGYLFVSITRMGLARDIAKCREAGVRLAAGEFIPYCVFPSLFEDNLVSLEKQEMNRVGISEESRVRSTLFRLHDDGTVSLVDISLK